MLLTCIKLPFAIKIFVLSIFEWPFYTGFTVLCHLRYLFCVFLSGHFTPVLLYFVFKIFVLSIFELPFYTGFTVLNLI